MDDARGFLRHVLATIAYRGGKVIADAPAGFGEMCAGPGCRTARENLAHIGDLFDWALAHARGDGKWVEHQCDSWEDEVQRFFDSIAALDAFLASNAPLRCDAARLFQGPLADSLMHFGQLATLRRLAGSPVRGENYFKAEITAGRVGPEQSSNRVEFD